MEIRRTYAKSGHHARRLHPLPVRIMHWINAVDDDHDDQQRLEDLQRRGHFRLAAFSRKPRLGRWAQHGLQWHFFGMWIWRINGLAYVTYGFVTGRFRRMLLPIRLERFRRHIKDALRLRLAHDDPTKYNTVQKLLYMGVISSASDRHVRAGDLEAGAIFGIAGAVRQLPDRAARPLPLHDRDRLVPGRARHTGAAGAADARRHDHRRSGVRDAVLRADAEPQAEREKLGAHVHPNPIASIFRPEHGVDQASFAKPALVEKIDRRNVLRGTLSLGALTLLTGCDVSENDNVQTVLRAVSSWNDRVQAFIFRPNHLAPTFSERRWSSRPASTPITTSKR